MHVRILLECHAFLYWHFTKGEVTFVCTFYTCDVYTHIMYILPHPFLRTVPSISRGDVAALLVSAMSEPSCVNTEIIAGGLRLSQSMGHGQSFSFKGVRRGAYMASHLIYVGRFDRR